jgi:alpha-L-fucosidase
MTHRPILKILFALSCLIHFGCAAQAEHRAAWLQEAKWGAMIHYQPEWLAQESGLEEITIEQWNDLVDNFDVDGLAEQLAEAGAGYLIMTVRHGPVFFLGQNDAYDRYTGQVPSRGSKRDLMVDLADALAKHDIKLIAYFFGQAPCFNEAEVEGFQTGRLAYYREGAFDRNAEGLRRWQEVLQEYSLRWGDKVSGWWIDATYRPNTIYRHPDAPNFESFTAALRSGNPDAIVCYNPGRFPRLMSITPHEDYTAGEVNDPTRLEFRYRHEGKIDGAQIHALSFLGRFWGQGEPRFSDQQIIDHTARVIKVRGAFTWDVPVNPNGLIKEPFFQQLKALGQVVPEMEIEKPAETAPTLMYLDVDSNQD